MNFKKVASLCGASLCVASLCVASLCVASLCALMYACGLKILLFYPRVIMLNTSTLVYLIIGAVLFVILGKIAAVANDDKYYIESAFRDSFVGIGMFGILMYTVPALFPDFKIQVPAALRKGDFDLQIGLPPK